MYCSRAWHLHVYGMFMVHRCALAPLDLLTAPVLASEPVGAARRRVPTIRSIQKPDLRRVTTCCREVHSFCRKRGRSLWHDRSYKSSLCLS